MEEENIKLKKSNNRKKAFIVILIFTLLLVGILVFVLLLPKEKEEPKQEEKYVMELDNYKGLLLNDIVSIEKIRYTEAGDQREEVTDKEEITRIYNMLNSTKIGTLTNRACEDNTTVYVLKTTDKNYSFEFECEWFVYSGKRYNVIK